MTPGSHTLRVWANHPSGQYTAYAKTPERKGRGQAGQLSVVIISCPAFRQKEVMRECDT